MRSSLPIGDFARATHLSVKTLRHYHQVGLLIPAAVDPDTGHRRYATEQIPIAQVIRRFRSLDMPLDDIGAVLTAPDVKTRNELIAAHLSRLEDSLARTQEAAASLRDLLQPHPAAAAAVEHRSVEPAPAAAVREVIDVQDVSPWYQGAMGELYATLAAQKITPAGPAGGIFASELFTDERGAATVFVPCALAPRRTGRVEAVVVPGAELALILHAGTPGEIDRAYGALATYVADHALAVDGPIREYYLVGSRETADETKWRTEIGWPIFRTGVTPGDDGP
jgi:DNA-binding transcriptional MerR regulator